jgi:hypothetical protein
MSLLVRESLELWQSLISMVKVYAANPSLGSERVVVNEASLNQTRVMCGVATLRLSLDFTDRIGEWQLEPSRELGDAGSFQLLPNGSVKWNKEEQQFDHAAIEWIGWVTRRAAQITLS